MTYNIRSETPSDADAIRDVATVAFEKAEHTDGNEATIVDALRVAGALTISLVATVNGVIVGHVAFSSVTIDDQDIDWFGLGPVSVHPERQGEGIGNALIKQGLEELRAKQAAGCVVLGYPNYYQRFGFRPDAAIVLPGVPQEYFMSLPWAVRPHTEPSGIMRASGYCDMGCRERHRHALSCLRASCAHGQNSGRFRDFQIQVQAADMGSVSDRQDWGG